MIDHVAGREPAATAAASPCAEERKERRRGDEEAADDAGAVAASVQVRVGERGSEHESKGESLMCEESVEEELALLCSLGPAFTLAPTAMRLEALLRVVGVSSTSAAEIVGAEKVGCETLLAEAVALRLVRRARPECSLPLLWDALLLASLLSASADSFQELQSLNMFQATHYRKVNRGLLLLLGWFRAAFYHVVLLNDVLRRPLTLRPEKLLDGVVALNCFRILAGGKGVATPEATAFVRNAQQSTCIARLRRFTDGLDSGATSR